MKGKELIESVRHALNFSGINIFEVSRSTGVSYNTLRSIKAGEGNPTIGTICKIESYLWSTKQGKSCKTCKFCLAFEPQNNLYGCEVVMGGSDEDPISCQMHKEK